MRTVTLDEEPAARIERTDILGVSTKHKRLKGELAPARCGDPNSCGGTHQVSAQHEDGARVARGSTVIGCSCAE